jgi:hypothetical protein
MNMSKRRIPKTLLLGGAIILVCEMLLLIDLNGRDFAIFPRDITLEQLPRPTTAVGAAARFVAVNMTAFCWVGYLLFFDGLLTVLARRHGDPSRSPIRARPNRFIVAWLTSIPVWCFFDWANFYFLDAWRYHGLPPFFPQRAVGYFIAFAAISPGMFLAGELYQQLGLRRVQRPHDRQKPAMAWLLVLGPTLLVAAVALLLQSRSSASPLAVITSVLILLGPAAVVGILIRGLNATTFACGLGLTAWALAMRDPLSTMTLWVGLIYLLDPICDKLAAPSLLADWRAGRWGRTLALFLGGATCGLLWEFWNFAALAKWTYHLPFLGSAESYRYFEMPWLGFLGFLPFAAECWVALNLMIAVLARLSLRVSERLSDCYQII